MTLINYKIDNLKEILQKIIQSCIEGAGTLGKLALNALYKLSIKVDCFWDDDKKNRAARLKSFNTEEILKIIKNAMFLFVVTIFQ